MRSLPPKLGCLHFVGIGGIGMSGIAEILHALGAQVQGSDIAENANVIRLRAKGIPIAIGHDAKNLGKARAIIVSSAVQADNPEVIEAHKRDLPVIPRADMLKELMRMKWGVGVAGSHGKTTTTSLIGHMLDVGGLEPTVITGGIVNAYGTNARLGHGDWIVVETDESDGSFVRLPCTVSVVTNIDPEHMDYYKKFETLVDAFRSFVTNSPFFGASVMCVDHPVVRQLMGMVANRRMITYGFDESAMIRGKNVVLGPKGCTFDVVFDGAETLEGVFVPMLGEHNVQNALAAIAVGHHMGMDARTIIKALATFSGVKRRFTIVDVVRDITIVDDYGHHPSEIKAVLKTAKHSGFGRIMAVVQPHRYSRVAHLMDEFVGSFDDADKVWISDVYAAGEKPIPGVDRDHLVAGIRQHGHHDVHGLESHTLIPQYVQEWARPGDLVIFLGAGNITQWANSLPSLLKTNETTDSALPVLSERVLPKDVVAEPMAATL